MYTVFGKFISSFLSKSLLFTTIILNLFLESSNNFSSSFVNFSLLFKTNKIKSDFSIISFDFSTPIFSTMSSVSLIPAVSIRFNVIPSMFNPASTMSLVVPGISVTIALSSSINLFKMLLFPTLGRPIIATFIPFVKSLLTFEFSINLSKLCSMVINSFFNFSIVNTSIS